MKGEMRVFLEVEQPPALPGVGRTADIDPAVDVVEDDLDPARVAAPAAGGRDVDGVPALQRGVNCVLGRSHVLESPYHSSVVWIPLKRSRRWLRIGCSWWAPCTWVVSIAHPR